MRLVVVLLAVVEARWPGAHRGYRDMEDSERGLFFELNGYAWPPAKATRGWPPVEEDESVTYSHAIIRV